MRAVRPVRAVDRVCRLARSRRTCGDSRELHAHFSEHHQRAGATVQRALPFRGTSTEPRTDCVDQRRDANQTGAEYESAAQYQRRPQLAPERSANRSTAPTRTKTMPTVQRIGIPATKP